MAWVILVLAGLFEAGMVIGLDASEGFTRLWGSLLMVISGGISFYLLSVAMQSIPAGTAYAVWTAIGASIAVLLGILFLGEPTNLLRLVGIAVVLGGVLVLRVAEGLDARLVSPEASPPARRAFRFTLILRKRGGFQDSVWRTLRPSVG
jgi:quaternary ammonium compound-resistance protein SugE